MEKQNSYSQPNMVEGVKTMFTKRSSKRKNTIMTTNLQRNGEQQIQLSQMQPKSKQQPDESMTLNKKEKQHT